MSRVKSWWQRQRQYRAQREPHTERAYEIFMALMLFALAVLIVLTMAHE